MAAKKQKEKPGKVLRVDQDTWNFIQSVREQRERLSDLVRRLVGLTPKGEDLRLPEELFTLPSNLYETRAEARGEALYRAVKEKTEAEKPIKVRKV